MYDGKLLMDAEYGTAGCLPANWRYSAKREIKVFTVGGK